MGNFNSQYQDYYSTLRGKQKGVKVLKDSSAKANRVYKRVLRDLIGALILFVLVLGCKTISTNNTLAVYNYSKKVVNENYDMTRVKESLCKLNFIGLQDKIRNLLEEAKAKITGEKPYNEKIKNEFTKPVEGVITSPFGERKNPVDGNNQFHSGVDIDVKLDTEVKACYEGRVKQCGEDKELGKYIWISHESGIETKYAHLNSIIAKKEDKVKKGQVIGKSGNTGKSTGPHLHFELLYMGEEENPEKYFSYKKNSN